MKNPQLKRAHSEDEYTPQMIQELVKCRKDPVYFLKHYIKVQHPTKGTIPFDLFDYQERFVRHMQENRFVITLQPRQCGKTLTVAMYLLWYAMFTDDVTVLIASKNQGHALEIAARVRFAYEELPSWIKCGLKYYNRHNIEFDNGSRIISEATTEKTGRGLAISKIYLDELAFINPRIQQALWSSLTPTLSTGGSAIISSTPNGDTELFASLWRGAMTEGDGKPGQNGYAPFRVYWQEHPERDDTYWDQMVSQLGLLQCRQEVGCVFGSTKIEIEDKITSEQRCVTIEDLTRELISERYTQNTLQDDLAACQWSNSEGREQSSIRDSSHQRQSLGRSSGESRVSANRRALRASRRNERSVRSNDDRQANGEDIGRTLSHSTWWEAFRSNQAKNLSDQKRTVRSWTEERVQRQNTQQRNSSALQQDSQGQGLGAFEAHERRRHLDALIARRASRAAASQSNYVRNGAGKTSSQHEISARDSSVSSTRSDRQELEVLIPNTRFRIKTPSGYQDFAGIRVVSKHQTVKIITSSCELRCSIDHLFSNGVKAGSLNVGDLLPTSSGYETISSITIEKGDQLVYDPIHVENGHLYISDGVISHNCEFLTSDAVLINSLRLIELQAKTVHHADMGFKFWKPEEDIGGAGKTYLVSIDPATGSGKDFSVIEVFDFPALEQIAEYRTNDINIPLFYAKVKWILEKLSALQGRGRAEVIWTFERNGIGEAMCALYLNDEKQPEHPELYCDIPGKYGVYTSGRTKILGCLQLKSLVEKIKNGFKINSEILIEELKNFVAKGGTYEAKSGSCDDTVMAMVGITRLIKRLAEYNEDAFKQVNEYVDPESNLDGEWGDEPVPFSIV